MRSMLKGIGTTALFLLWSLTADAAALRVAPTTVELMAPDSAVGRARVRQGDTAPGTSLRKISPTFHEPSLICTARYKAASKSTVL